MAPVVLITGASQGTGRATALRFAREGYDAVLAARQPDRLEAAAQAVRNAGRRAIAVPTDVGDASQVQQLAARALAEFGQVDVLVNNAGICLTGPLADTDLGDWERLLRTNLWGCIHTLHALLPQFLARGSGAIVNVGSFGGKMPLPDMAAYCASKYAVAGLTETLRLELTPRGIRVCAVHPGVIASDFMERAEFRGATEDEARDRRDRLQGMLDSAAASQPEDVAEAIWDAARTGRAETVVGPAALAVGAYQFAPGLVQWALTPR